MKNALRRCSWQTPKQEEKKLKIPIACSSAEQYNSDTHRENG